MYAERLTPFLTGPTARRSYARNNRHGRRGAVAALVAVSLTLLVGMAALVVDVGVMYNARAELQRTADAAAMAAAAELGDYSEGDPLTDARQAAAEFAALNTVTQMGVGLDETDVIFGRAYMDEDTGKYTFDETEAFPNAVCIRARRTSDSPTGPVNLFFARIFGIESTDIAASATAALTPRDIAFVLDLSTSHNDDSSLRSYKKTEIGNKEFWQSLKQIIDPEAPGDPTVGPLLGNMDTWGDDVTGPGWDFASDAGLARIKKYSGSSISQAWMSKTLNAKGFGTYTSAETSAVNSSSYDSKENGAYYKRRVLVALGIYRWKSGKSGGQYGGNGNNYIGGSEVELMVPYPDQSINPDTEHVTVDGSWYSFVDYVRKSSSRMCQYDPDDHEYGDPGLQYRYGLKTWVDYLQEKQYGDDSPGLDYTRQQPMAAVFDAVDTSINIIEGLESGDLVGLASYATYGYGPSNKPASMSWLTDNLNDIRGRIETLQPGEWTTNTNIAGGIDKGVEVLFGSDEARPNAAKVMLLLTDGIANTIRDGSAWNEYWAKEDAKAAASEAAAEGVRIYTVSVGVNADTQLMHDIAEIGSADHFHAEGSIEEYSEQLEEIFRKLGGKRPVVLIE